MKNGVLVMEEVVYKGKKIELKGPSDTLCNDENVIGFYSHYSKPVREEFIEDLMIQEIRRLRLSIDKLTEVLLSFLKDYKK